MHPEDLILISQIEPMPEAQQIIDSGEIGLPAYQRWNTYTYYLDLPDALVWELERQ